MQSREGQFDSSATRP
nr:unnamed protein product [Callosobruchus chinensis]CAH7721564.1 unnamed protein product [Callosobruchus chinensis]